MRGGSDGTNYSQTHVESAAGLLKKAGIKNQAVMIDCSHGNSSKLHKNQPIVAADIAKQISNGSNSIMGVMIESNLVEGNQKMDPGKTEVSKLVYGQSITDACIHFPDTKASLEGLANAVKARRTLKAGIQRTSSGLATNAGL